jgi:hypothetical protein
VDGSVRGEERHLAIKNFGQQPIFIFLLSTRAGRPSRYNGSTQIIGGTLLYIPSITTFSHNSLKGEAVTKEYKKEGTEVIATLFHGPGLLEAWQHFYPQYLSYDFTKEVRLKFGVEHTLICFTFGLAIS